MSGADRPAPTVDEFDHIARLLAPLTRDAPEALGLRDDAAVIPSRPGFDLVVTTDTLVEGVHFLPADPLDLVAGKLLRVNLSDLAAKAADPYGYFVCASWSPRCGWAERSAFAAGLAADQARFGLSLMGGDTTSTPGPLTFSLTALGWVKAGQAVRRAGALPGDRILVSGVIGDGALGLQAALGTLAGSDDAEVVALLDRYRSPQPRLALRDVLAAHASGAADVSDGLLADAGHIGEASGCAVVIELDRIPLSSAARAWLLRQPDRIAALAGFAAGGDDYEVVMTVPPHRAGAAIAQARVAGLALTDVGHIDSGQGLSVLCDGAPYAVERTGYRHG